MKDIEKRGCDTYQFQVTSHQAQVTLPYPHLYIYTNISLLLIHRMLKLTIRFKFA